VGKVFALAGRQIIDTDNRVPIREQTVCEVRTKKSGSAGDENAHVQISSSKPLCIGEVGPGIKSAMTIDRGARQSE
jgi:hypothetical protein